MSDTIESVVAEGSAVLSAAGVNEPRSDATHLLMHVLGRDRVYVFAHSEDLVSRDNLQKFRSLIERRAAGYPLQYLTYHQPFFKLDFEVSEDVLIPRPETEIIVEAALELMTDLPAPLLADVGTGSGCIAISILNEVPQARGVALDASPAALEMAKRNAARHKVLDRLELLKSDLFASLDPDARFDLIVSNPPYIPTSDLGGLQREVQREPQSALDGGADGLEVIRRLLRDAPGHLPPAGYLIFEIGFNQDSPVRQLIDERIWNLVDVRRDLQGIPRTFVLQRR